MKRIKKFERKYYSNEYLLRNFNVEKKKFK